MRAAFSMVAWLALSPLLACFEPSEPGEDGTSQESTMWTSVGTASLSTTSESLTSASGNMSASSTSDTSELTSSLASHDSTNTSTDTEICSVGSLRLCNEHPGHDGLGECKAGTQRCIEGIAGDGTWEACTGDVGPAAHDSCAPGADDNCNGAVNEGCTCASTEQAICGPANVGICQSGVQHCIDGAWGACEGAIYPSVRDCSSPQDHDCDGMADNSLDESCRCQPDQTRPCESHPDFDGKGVCQAGEQTCVFVDGSASTQWDTCTGAVGPSAQDDCENSLDTNCDGDLTCECTPLQKEACGACSEGQRTCDDQGKWGACVGAAGPALTYYRDGDSDGFGDGSQEAKIVCDGSTPSGHVANADDCCDQDANMQPDQTAFFEHASSACGNSFDYNCSGEEERQGILAFCPTNGDCPGTSIIKDGWSLSPKVLTCGDDAVWVDCMFAAISCQKSMRSEPVLCH